MDWQAFFFDSKHQWPERLQERARRRFIQPLLAEEAYNYAFELLSAQQWRILQRYNRQASAATFLIAVYNNLLEDFARSRFGRPRPPAWLERLGVLWTRIYQLICLQRLDKQTVVESLTTPQGPDAAKVLEAIRVIRARIPHCGETTGPSAAPPLPDDLLDLDPPAPPSCMPETHLAEEDLAVLLQVLAQLLAEQTTAPAAPASHSPALAKHVQQQWQRVQNTLELSGTERLILRLLYQEDKTITAAARALGMAEHQVRRQHARALKRLREVMHAAGLTAEMLRELTDN